MTLLEYLLIFAVVLLLIWQASVLLAAGRLQREADAMRSTNKLLRDQLDSDFTSVSRALAEIRQLQAENKQLKHDLEQYKDGCEEHANQACVYREKIADLQETIRDVRKALDE